MLCGWAHPLADQLLQRIDALSLRARVFVRTLVLSAVAVAALLWCALNPRTLEPAPPPSQWPRPSRAP